MSVFITGATGFVGRNLVEWLTKNEPERNLFCLVRSPEKADFLTALENVTIVEGDLLNPESYQKSVEQCDIVLHVAAMVGLRDGDEFYEANTKATENLCNAAKSNPNLKRFVFVSSISAGDRPLDIPAKEPLTEDTPSTPNTDYGKSKLMAEEAIINSGLPYTLLRPSYIYGPHPRKNSSADKLVYDMQGQKPYTRFPFQGRVSEIHVLDLARIIWTSATLEATENQLYYVSNDEPVHLKDFFPLLAEVMNTPFQQRGVSDKIMARFKRGVFQKYSTQTAKLAFMKVLFENGFYCSNQKLVKDTGYKPEYPLRIGVEKTIDWYKQNDEL